MPENNFTNITKKDLFLYPDKYLWIRVTDDYSNDNFKKLLEFIEKPSDYGKRPIKQKNNSHNETYFGNAFYRIRMKTNYLLGVGIGSLPKLKTSKKEIHSIMDTILRNCGRTRYIKIPYKISYIFMAILIIIEEIEEKEKIKLPKEIYGDIPCTYGSAFYDFHIRNYSAYINDLRRRNLENIGYGLKVELENDFWSEASVFRKNIKMEVE